MSIFKTFRLIFCKICCTKFCSMYNVNKDAVERRFEMKRYAQVIRVKAENLEKYKELHANPWSSVNKMIRACNIRNYSIYLRDGYLFSYFEYVGDDFEADMKKMAEDPDTQAWWKETDPCQEPVASAKPGQWWADMEEVYHLD